MQRRALVALGVLTTASALVLGSTFAGDMEPKLGEAAPAFTLQDQTGKMVNLSDFAGKVVVLEWLNPECPFVVRHYKAKTMSTLVDKYKDKNVVWLAINSTNTATSEFNGSWVSENSLTYPILNDREGKVGKLYGAKTTPHMYVIDPSGKLVYRGAIDDDPSGQNGGKGVNYVDQALDEVLAGKAVSVPETKSYGCSVKYAA